MTDFEKVEQGELTTTLRISPENGPSESKAPSQLIYVNKDELPKVMVEQDNVTLSTVKPCRIWNCW